MAKVIYEFDGKKPITQQCEGKDIIELVVTGLNAKETNNTFFPNDEKERREGKSIKSIRIEF
ncbi:hypothetical protein [Aneurinibacillus migulanus]|uniref:Uncharacterized protein n=1 Tax=Aneurinibacillus migulanus TaxID=47500 RepID=A0A0D1VDK3_ANEMI|nr:hypothetical protein [Aneurinibacillus migulanus]KIV57509.1 hypothetical protein TS65_09810 [Aneurinibacillus migulanus]KON94876.1 hypothetical protein AF333_04615 [Aneurinibacillus migulanus]MED0892858.1 hypothetical protein [Aneurinibacillus migulanus]MED1619104.1 hypothetical protein [Aneurinibacillus migulanus]SDI92439.1 hypothetical protein SAMN04487909_109108 [Aneurinibacillus migulanus]